MEKRFLSELNGEELTFVWEKNYGLQEEVRNYYEQWILDTIEDYMYTLKSGLSDWCIGLSGIYIIPKFSVEFIDAVEKTQHDFYLLYDNENPTKYEEMLVSARDKYNQLDDIEDGYDEFEKEVKNIFWDLSNAMVKQFESELNYSEEDLVDFFFNDWLEYNADDGYFINDDYELFLTTTKTKSFK